MNKRTGIAFLLLVFIAGALGAGCSSDQERKTAHYQKAVGYFEKEDYKSAELELRNAVRIDPSFRDAQLKLGEVYLKLGNPQESFKVYSTVVQLDPDNYDAHLKMALFYLLGKKIPEARDHVEIVLKAEPENTQALFLLACMLDMGDNAPEALSVLDKVLLEDQNLVQAYWGKAQVFARKDLLVEAEATLKQALKIDPGNLKTSLMLYQFYVDQHDFAMAERVLNEAAGQHPENADLLITKANLYNRMNETVKAEAALKSAMAIAPQGIKPLMFAAGFYETIGQQEMAESLYRKALDHQPENVAVLAAAARHHALNKNLSQARTYVAKALAIQPKYPPARILDGEILLAEKKFDDAAAVFENVTRDEPSIAFGHYLKGVAYSKKGEANRSKTALLKALELNPKLFKAKILLASLYLQEGAYALAEKESGEVVAASKNNFQAQLIFGNACLHQKKPKAAKTAFETLVELEPDNPVGYYRLGVLQQVMKQQDAARKNFDKALELNPMLMDVFAGLIRNEVMAGNARAAIERCDRHLELFAASSTPAAVIYSLKGAVCLVLKDLPAAEASFKAALDQDPNYLKPYYELARIYLAGNHQDKAIAQCRALLAKNPKQPSTHMLLGILYEMQNQCDLSETHYRKALDVDQEFAPAANNLACLLTGKDLNEAYKFAQIAKAKLPNDPFVADTIGWIYCRKGLFDNAIRELRDSAEKLPANPEVHYHLGMAYAGKLEKDFAKASLKKALVLKMDFNGAEEARKTLGAL